MFHVVTLTKLDGLLLCFYLVWVVYPLLQLQFLLPGQHQQDMLHLKQHTNIMMELNTHFLMWQQLHNINSTWSCDSKLFCPRGSHRNVFKGLKHADESSLWNLQIPDRNKSNSMNNLPPIAYSKVNKNTMGQEIPVCFWRTTHGQGCDLPWVWSLELMM